MRAYRFGCTLIVAGLLSCPSQAATVESAPLAASSPWHVNYSDDSCRLARTFGKNDAPVILVLDSFAPGQEFKLIVAGKPVLRTDSANPIKLRFGPSEEAQTMSYFVGDLGKNIPAFIFRGSVFLGGLPADMPTASDWRPKPISAERVAAINELTIGSSRRALRLALGSMRAPLAALEKCTDALLVKWGVDPIRYATLSRSVLPKGDPRYWLRNGDYPPEAIGKGAQGIVNFRLSVDETGKPTACFIQQSTRPPEFDKVVCKAIMRRAQFEPAFDKDGAPFKSFYRNSVVFVID